MRSDDSYTVRETVMMAGMTQPEFFRAVETGDVVAELVGGKIIIRKWEAWRLLIRRSPMIRKGLAAWMTCGKHVMIARVGTRTCPGIPDRGLCLYCGDVLRAATPDEVIGEMDRREREAEEREERRKGKGL